MNRRCPEPVRSRWPEVRRFRICSTVLFPDSPARFAPDQSPGSSEWAISDTSSWPPLNLRAFLMGSAFQNHADSPRLESSLLRIPAGFAHSFTAHCVDASLGMPLVRTHLIRSSSSRQATKGGSISLSLLCWGRSFPPERKPNQALQRTQPQCHPCCLLRGLRCQHGRHRGGAAELGR